MALGGVRRLIEAEWLAFERAHPAPTFFAGPFWALSLQQAYGNMQAAPLRISVDGSSVLLPLVRLSGGPLRWREYCGFPLGTYTCFLREDGSHAGAFQCMNALQEAARHIDAATIVPWPLGPAAAIGAGAAHETTVVSLTDGLEAALQRLDGNFRRMAGQAARRGVECAPSRDPDAVDRYYELLRASAHRWGRVEPGIPKALFSALRSLAGDAVEIWFARAEGRDVAGGVVLYGAQESFFWSAAMLSEFGRLRPSNALNIALIRRAAERGMRWFNLGSSEGLPGVARFKREMGSTDVAYSDVSLSKVPFRLYTGVRRLFPSRFAG